jgi:hypothetical protein
MKRTILTLTLFFVSMTATASQLNSYECYQELQSRPNVEKMKTLCWKGKDSAFIQTYKSLVGVDDPFREKCLVDKKHAVYVSAGQLTLRTHIKMDSYFHKRPDLPYFGLLGETPNSRTHEIEKISRENFDVGGSIEHNFVTANFVTRSKEIKKISIDFTNAVGTMSIDNEKIEFDGCADVTER